MAVIICVTPPHAVIICVTPPHAITFSGLQHFLSHARAFSARVPWAFTAQDAHHPTGLLGPREVPWAFSAQGAGSIDPARDAHHPAGLNGPWEVPWAFSAQGAGSIDPARCGGARHGEGGVQVSRCLSKAFPDLIGSCTPPCRFPGALRIPPGRPQTCALFASPLQKRLPTTSKTGKIQSPLRWAHNGGAAVSPPPSGGFNE